MSPYRSRRRARRQAGNRSTVAFLLVACFGILFAGCGGNTSEGESADEFAFTEDDVARFRELVMEDETGITSTAPHLVADETEDGGPPVLDLSKVDSYMAVRSGISGEDVFRVTNVFVNLRTAPRVTSEQVGRLVKGDAVTVLGFHDAAWAHVKLPNGREGYVSNRYIAKMASEEGLAAEKAKYEGQYFVNFGFLNVRKDPDTQSEKLGELSSQAIVKPLSTDQVWARVPFEGKEGYVAVDYLKPFLPNFLVRQQNYDLPVLHYHMDREGMQDALVKHVGRLQQEGANIMTLNEFKDLLITQEDRDVRLEPKSVVLGISGLSATNVKDVSDILRASNVNATFFIGTQSVGVNGITQQNLLTLIANRHDVQSAGHTGDDLRSLTNAQVELELKQARQLLEQATGKSVFSIAYPGGGVNERVETIAAEAGYLLGLGSMPVRSFSRAELLRMPSYQVTTSMSEDDVLSIVLGQ